MDKKGLFGNIHGSVHFIKTHEYLEMCSRDFFLLLSNAIIHLDLSGSGEKHNFEIIWPHLIKNYSINLASQEK